MVRCLFDQYLAFLVSGVGDLIKQTNIHQQYEDETVRYSRSAAYDVWSMAWPV